MIFLFLLHRVYQSFVWLIKSILSFPHILRLWAYSSSSVCFVPCSLFRFLALIWPNCLFPLILQISFLFLLGFSLGASKLLFLLSPIPHFPPLLPSLPAVRSLPVAHILSLNAGRINPAENTMSESRDRCTKACSGDKRQL